MSDLQQNLSDIRSDLADFALLVDELEHENFKLKNENADLKAKLAKAVEGLQCWDTMLDNPQYDLGEMAEEFTTIVRTTLKELTGGKDE